MNINKKAQWAFSPAVLTHPTPWLTTPYLYVAQHSNQRDETCDCVTQYFDYCVTADVMFKLNSAYLLYRFLFILLQKNKFNSNADCQYKYAHN